MVVSAELRHPNCASGSQEIRDFLGVVLQVQQHAVLSAPNCASGVRSPFRCAQEDYNFKNLIFIFYRLAGSPKFPETILVS
jgi:hypothetical protein